MAAALLLYPTLKLMCVSSVSTFVRVSACVCVSASLRVCISPFVFPTLARCSCRAVCGSYCLYLFVTLNDVYIRAGHGSNKDGNTAVHLAAVRGHIDTIEYLIQKTNYDCSLVLFVSIPG